MIKPGDRAGKTTTHEADFETDEEQYVKADKMLQKELTEALSYQVVVQKFDVPNDDLLAVNFQKPDRAEVIPYTFPEVKKSEVETEFSSYRGTIPHDHHFT